MRNKITYITRTLSALASENPRSGFAPDASDILLCVQMNIQCPYKIGIIKISAYRDLRHRYFMRHHPADLLQFLPDHPDKKRLGADSSAYGDLLRIRHELTVDNMCR